MVLAIVLGTFFVLSLGYLAWQALTWIFVAAFLAMALNPAVALVERRGVSRGVSSAVVFLVTFVALVGIGFLLIPPLVREVIDFVEAVPGLIDELDQGRGPLGFLEREYGLVDRAQEAVDTAGAGGLLGFTTPVVGVMKAVAATAFGIVAIGFLTFFMLLDGRRWIDLFLDFVPEPSRPRWERVFAGVYRTVGGYVTGNLLISAAAGIVAGVLLYALGVPFALPLAILVAILDLLPLVGATIATVIVAAVALTEGWVKALVVVGVLLAYQQFENHVLQPLVYGRSVNLSPLAVLIAILVGGELAGILGALAAIPIGGSIAVVAGELVSWRRESMIEAPAGVAPPAVGEVTGD